MQKIAIIDIGSNTIHLDIFKVSGITFTKIASKGAILTLGVHLTGRNMIPREKIVESVAVINALCQFAKMNGATDTHIFATSILRKAANAQAFTRAVKRKCHLEIDILSGLDECRSIERAARFFLPKNERVLMVDIGGGSTEFILFDKDKTYLRKSYAYGLSQVKGKFNISLSSETCTNETISRFFDAKVRLFAKGVIQYKFTKIIVTSSVAKVIASLKYGGMIKVTDSGTKKIGKSDLTALQHTLCTQPNTVKLSAPKKELVYIGTYFFIHLLKYLNKKTFYIGPFSVREGYLLKTINV